MTFSLSNIVSYYSLEETSGTRVDQRPPGNDLLQSGNPLSAAGIQGNAALFDRSLSQYLTISDAAQSGLDITGNFTIWAWIYLNSLPSVAASDFGVVGKFAGSGNNKSYLLLVDVTNKARMAVSANGSTQTDIRATTFGDVPTGAQVFLFGRYDGSNLYLRVNTTDQTPVAFTGALFDCAAAVHIGDYNTFRFFDGRIDEVGIANEYAPDSFGTWLYNSGAGRSYSDITTYFTPTVSLNSAWNVRALTTKTLQSSWNVRALTQKDFQSAWNVRGLTQKDFQSAWNVRSLTQKDTQTSWNIRALVQKDLQSSWNARRTVKGTATVSDSAVATATVSDS